MLKGVNWCLTTSPLQKKKFGPEGNSSTKSVVNRLIQSPDHYLTDKKRAFVEPKLSTKLFPLIEPFSFHQFPKIRDS